jgi:ribosomal protein L3 glutamine methyltransferase
VTAVTLKKGDCALDCVHVCEHRLQVSGVFFGHAADNALDESIALVCHVLEVAVTDEDWQQQQLNTDQIANLQDLLRQRIEERVPVAYLTGHVWFAGLRFKVDRRALIPRSPIAELIEAGFELWLKQSKVKMLDLCTGSGCIAIAAAVNLPEASVDAVDLSPTALELAAENVRLHSLEDRVCLRQSDLFEQLCDRRYDLIVSNPPYVGAEEMANLPQEYLQEPAIALASGRDGLDLPLKILRDAAGHLEDNGVLIMEVGNSEESLQLALPKVPFLWLEFERGGHGVLVLDRRQLQVAQADILRLVADRELSGYTLSS